MFRIQTEIDSILGYISNKVKYTDIRYGNIEERRINAINGKIYNDYSSNISGYGIRILRNGILSFISIPEIKLAKSEIDRIINTTEIAVQWRKGITDLSDAPVVNASVARKPQKDWQLTEKEDISQHVKDIYDYIKSGLKSNAKIESDLLFIHWTEYFTNSDGSHVYQDYTYSVLTLTARLLKNGLNIRFYQNFGGLGGLEVLPITSFEKLDHFIDTTNNLSNAILLPRGRYPALLNEDIAWTLIHEVLGHSLEADNVLSGHSFSAGLLGMKIAPSSVSVLDDPYIETLGYYEYDSEGMKGKGTLLVDEGILTDFLHSRETAAAMGAESSSNYRAYSYQYLPQVRMSNTFIEPKDFKFEELLEQVKNGIYVCDGIEGSSEPQTGKYSIDAQYGRKIENGELKDYVIGFQIGGRITETLSLINGVGNNLYAQPGSCVKNNQRIYVGSISPPISVSSIRVR